MAFPIPPLSFNLGSSASSGLDSSGAQFGASFGDWTVNVAGSGTSAQSATGGGINWLLVAAVVAAWYFLKK